RATRLCGSAKNVSGSRRASTGLRFLARVFIACRPKEAKECRQTFHPFVILQFFGSLLRSFGGCFLSLPLFAQAVGEVVRIVFRPREPQLPNLPLREDRQALLLIKPRQVSPMLLGDRQDIDATLGGLSDILGNLLHDGARIAGPEHHPAIDEQVSGFAAASRKSEQEI